MFDRKRQRTRRAKPEGLCCWERGLFFRSASSTAGSALRTLDGVGFVSSTFVRHFTFAFYVSGSSGVVL